MKNVNYITISNMRAWNQASC